MPYGQGTLVITVTTLSNIERLDNETVEVAGIICMLATVFDQIRN